MDFKRGVKISGSRFVLLRGQLALLERALSTFMIETHLNDDEFEEISPPFLVKEHALFGTGQLPKFSDALLDRGDALALTPSTPKRPRWTATSIEQSHQQADELRQPPHSVPPGHE